MRPSSKTVVLVFLVTIVLGGGMTVFYLQNYGMDEDTLGVTLRVSAWAGLLIYLVIFVSRPLKQLGGGLVARRLVENRRYVGVAFAAIMIVHLILLLILNGFVPNVPGGMAYLFILLMLLTSFDGAVAALGPRRWRRLHKIGLYWIGAIFAATIVGGLAERPDSPVHLALACLFLSALAVRATAFIKERRRSTLQDTRHSLP